MNRMKDSIIEAQCSIEEVECPQQRKITEAPPSNNVTTWYREELWVRAGLVMIVIIYIYVDLGPFLNIVYKIVVCNSNFDSNSLQNTM